MARRVVAHDGMVARDSGEWGLVKLEFLDAYAPVALDATDGKFQKYFLDLFAGPGLNVGRDAGGEFDGSPLRALELCGKADSRRAFTHLVACNNRLEYRDVLRTRVSRRIEESRSRIPPGNISVECVDSAIHVPNLMQRIDPKAYVLVFADIQGVKEWPWTAVEALRANGHSSVDLVMLFPLEMCINRLVSFQANMRERYASSLTMFFGTQEWRRIARERITDAHGPEFRGRITDLYLRRLRTQFRFVKELRDVRLRGGRVLYRLLFASCHEAGDRIADWARGLTEGERQLKFL